LSVAGTDSERHRSKKKITKFQKHTLIWLSILRDDAREVT